MFVIPTKFDPERAVVFDCVQGIREHHPDARILVVDSDSDNRSYLTQLDCETAAIGNRNYAPGAFKYALETNPDVEFFYLFFDSLLVHDNLDDLQGHELTTVRWFDGRRTTWGVDQSDRGLDLWAADQGVTIPAEFKGVFGPMIAAHRSVIENADLFRILPTTVYHQQALERCWGIWLQEAGYDPAASCLQGEMVDFFGDYPSDRVEKKILARA